VEVLPEMTPAQAAQLAEAFATAGHYNQEVLHGVCQVVTQALVASDHHLTAASAAAADTGTETAAAMAATPQPSPGVQLAISIPAAATEAMVAGTDAHATGVTPEEMVAVASACRQLRHHDLTFLEAVAAAALRGGHLLSLEHMVQVSWGCTQPQIRGGVWVGGW
jgi:hypothetical protein